MLVVFLEMLGWSLLGPQTSIFIPVRNMPIDLNITRATDIPIDIFDGSSPIAVGITGSDILWEAGMENAGQEITVYPEASGPRMYYGVYSRYADRISSLEDLNGKIIATKYPRIANESFERRGIGIRTKEFSGKIEGKDNVYPFLVGLVDVIDSGKTAKANGIKILEEFYKINARIINAPGKLTQLELSILEDLQELIEVTMQKRRMAA